LRHGGGLVQEDEKEKETITKIQGWYLTGVRGHKTNAIGTKHRRGDTKVVATQTSTQEANYLHRKKVLGPMAGIGEKLKLAGQKDDKGGGLLEARGRRFLKGIRQPKNGTKS